MKTESIHIAVMTDQLMELVAPRAGGSYLDATLGGGTHTSELLERSGPDGHVVSLDVDAKALERAKKRFQAYGSRWLGVHTNFGDLEDVALRHGWKGFDGIIFDLGFSSDELEDASKGLSFKEDGPLDMRLGSGEAAARFTAEEIVNSWRQEELAEIIRTYGEERMAGRIARAICDARKSGRITRTVRLAEIVAGALPRNYERGRIHPATRTFQALRIAVNDELEVLKSALSAAIGLLKPKGRIAVISFHSLEDRIVKHLFKQHEELEILTKKPLIPTDEEMAENPRSRSAKLRGASKKSNTQKIQTKNKYAKRLRHVDGTAT